MADSKFLLPCQCGERLVVESKLAGVEVECQACGRIQLVPTLGRLRQLDVADSTLPLARVPGQPDAPDANVPSVPMGAESSEGESFSSPSPTAHSANAFNPLVVVGCILLFLVAAGAVWMSFSASKAESESEVVVVDLVDTEEWILAQTPRLKKLKLSALNLVLPDSSAVGLFNEQIGFAGLAGDTPDIESAGEVANLDTASYAWKVADELENIAIGEQSLWASMFSTIRYFERTKFYIVRAAYDSNDKTKINSDVGFEGVGKDREGNICQVSAKVKLTWQSDEPDKEKSNWRIEKWVTKSMHLKRRKQRMFREVLDLAIPDEDLRERVRRSLHEEMLVDVLSGNATNAPKNHFSQLEVSTSEHHPGLSVVDIDHDGHDDLYVMARWGRNILLHNQGDGTFVDIAPELGLDIQDRCSSAVFADFDNDGDFDVMIGRSMKPSLYLVNENETFVDRSLTWVEGPLPALVFAVSATDFNQDGLLDVFFATSAVKAGEEALKAILPPDDAKAFSRKLQEYENHTVLAKPGPPNVLLVNQGNGRFQRAEQNEQIAVYRNTNQATWGDFDDDGDQDLYLANDFSVNTFLRNDGERGFTDVTAETETADIGFGMGAAWGDYDNDQRLDLYVTNMFSKAGRRITAQLESLDTRFANMARGNSLFHNRAGRFEKVSGLEPPALQVEKAGWSWGGQFVDIDNNGWLDIYALSGYYTAPEEVALDVDL